MLDEDRVRIRHMLDAATEVVGFVSGRQRSDLDSDRMLLFAVVRGIEVIGEAAAKVTLEARELSPTIPWAAIVSMRHRLVHGYFDVDPDIACGLQPKRFRRSSRCFRTWTPRTETRLLTAARVS